MPSVRVNLPTDLLRSFVTIVETGSMARASEHVFLTQSALSLQMKRLADILQQPIFQRFQGAMVLTPAGEALLESARSLLAINDQIIAKLGGRLAGPARIGMVQDFSDAILSGVLARFKRLNPDIQMEIRVAPSTDLMDLVSSELLDIALYLGFEEDESSVVAADLAWFGEPDLLTQPILPVAMMAKPCFFREAMIASLEASSRPYGIMIETPSISVLRAAVESGLAITCRTGAFLGHHYVPLEFGEGPLPKIHYKLAMQNAPHPAVESLAELVRAALINL